MVIDHACKPDEALNEVHVCISKVKKRFREEENIGRPMSKIYEAEVRNLYDGGLDFVTSIPKFESVTTVLNRQRDNAIGTIKDPVDCKNIDWPVNIFNSFLLVEDGVGCDFHFNQCLWRKVQSIGLVEGYGNDESIRLHIRMCASLAFLSVSDVVDGWLVIMENAPNGSQID
ncbi:hypothetical protein JTB14_031184 [Gonioctena quinquepunctata]|nr:hypothetical protein JTB14_031184 [Gonioctena quinquepunctata]